MSEKTLEELQVLQSEMLATATDLGVKIPDDLSLEFQTIEVGRATCDGLDGLIREFRRGMDTADESAAPEADASGAAVRVGGSKPRKRKTSPKKVGDGKTTVSVPSDKVTDKTTDKTKASATASADATEEKDMTATAKKATAKKGAKKAKTAAPKKAAKKAAGANARTPVKRTKFAEGAKIIAIEKSPEVLKKDTKWAKRLAIVYKYVGKKVTDYVEGKGSIADLTSAIQKKLVKVG